MFEIVEPFFEVLDIFCLLTSQTDNCLKYRLIIVLWKLLQVFIIFNLLYFWVGAVIHSHGIHAVLASLLFKGKEFRITRIEMIKGIKKGMTNEPYKSVKLFQIHSHNWRGNNVIFCRYDDTLVVPIVENDLYERNLTNRMKIAMEMYPESNAVLVRRHGIYVWGTTWQRAKSQ